MFCFCFSFASVWYLCFLFWLPSRCFFCSFVFPFLFLLYTSLSFFHRSIITIAAWPPPILDLIIFPPALQVSGWVFVLLLFLFPMSSLLGPVYVVLFCVGCVSAFPFFVLLGYLHISFPFYITSLSVFLYRYCWYLVRPHSIWNLMILSLALCRMAPHLSSWVFQILFPFSSFYHSELLEISFFSISALLFFMLFCLCLCFCFLFAMFLITVSRLQLDGCAKSRPISKCRQTAKPAVPRPPRQAKTTSQWSSTSVRPLCVWLGATGRRSSAESGNITNRQERCPMSTFLNHALWPRV